MGLGSQLECFYQCLSFFLAKKDLKILLESIINFRAVIQSTC